jgi:hypothetical protein
MFDGVLIGCGVMVVSIGCSVSMVFTFGGDWDFYSNPYQCFCEECWPKFLVTFSSCFSSLVFNQVFIFIVECSLFVEGLSNHC